MAYTHPLLEARFRRSNRAFFDSIKPASISVMGNEKSDREGTFCAPDALQLFADNLKLVRVSGEYSDLVIASQGKEWKVHKLVVCSQSAALKKTLERGSQLEKSDKARIDLDDDPDVIEAMVQFLYTSDYSHPGPNTDTARPENTAPIVLDAQIFAIADKYFIQPLMILAAKKFEVRCNNEWDTTGFADAVDFVYTKAPDHDRTLKVKIINVIRNQCGRIFNTTSKTQFEELESVLRSVAEFAADCCTAIATKGHEVVAYKCPSCAKVFRVGAPPPKYFGCSEGHYQDYGEEWWHRYKV